MLRDSLGLYGYDVHMLMFAVGNPNVISFGPTLILGDVFAPGCSDHDIFLNTPGKRTEPGKRVGSVFAFLISGSIGFANFSLTSFASSFETLDYRPQEAGLDFLGPAAFFSISGAFVGGRSYQKMRLGYAWTEFSGGNQIGFDSTIAGFGVGYSLPFGWHD